MVQRHLLYRFGKECHGEKNKRKYSEKSWLHSSSLLGSVHSDVVVQDWHHVREIIEAVSLKDAVNDLEHAPHVLTDLGGGQVAGQRQGLFVELHDGVGENMVDGLKFNFQMIYVMNNSVLWNKCHKLVFPYRTLMKFYPYLLFFVC